MKDKEQLEAQRGKNAKTNSVASAGLTKKEYKLTPYQGSYSVTNSPKAQKGNTANMSFRPDVSDFQVKFNEQGFSTNPQGGSGAADSNGYNVKSNESINKNNNNSYYEPMNSSNVIDGNYGGTFEYKGGERMSHNSSRTNSSNKSKYNNFVKKPVIYGSQNPSEANIFGREGGY